MELELILLQLSTSCLLVLMKLEVPNVMLRSSSLYLDERSSSLYLE